MPSAVQFVFHGQRKIETLDKEEAFNTLNQAIEILNESLDADKVLVTFIKQLSPESPGKPKLLDARYNMLLGIKIGKRTNLLISLI